ncbi:membrane-associated protein [Gammaproteobacteria bacterium]
MNGYVTATVEWLNLHPHWAGITVFLINVSESLVVVGLFVPGTIIMFGIGALVALGGMGLWATLSWAILGALVGDGVSYLIGRHYREHLRTMWPFNNHPEWLGRAERFFVRHGAKSVVFGRFAGPVRPIIPAVAGMMGMPVGRFYWANFLSAITWAPAYILPGVVFGASLTLASKVATRLMMILVLLLLVVWATAWLVRRIYALLQPRTQRMVLHLLAWGQANPLFEDVTVGLLDPKHPELKGLVELGVTLLFGGWIFFAILLGEIGQSQPLGLDYQVYYLLHGLRTSWADQVMIFISELADAPVNLAVAGTGLVWLMVRRHWLAATHWAAAVAMAVLVGIGFNYLLPDAIPRPEIYLGEMSDSFPSIHAALVSTLYGFLAVLVARELPPTLRRLPYTIAAVWIILVAISHLYLGRHWLSDIVGGITLGAIWSGLIGIAYRRRASSSLNLRELGGVLLLTVLITGSGYITTHHSLHVIRYEVRHPQRILNASRWWDEDWAELAGYRVDWRGNSNTPMTFQVAGDPMELRRYLELYGWRVPAPLDTASVLRLFIPKPEVIELPVLPYFHDGRKEVLRMICCYSGTETSPTRLVLRLWQADAQLTPGEIPLWVGNVARQQFIEPLGLVALAKTGLEYDAPLATLRTALEGLPWREAKRKGPYPEGWGGTVLLLNVSKK